MGKKKLYPAFDTKKRAPVDEEAGCLIRIRSQFRFMKKSARKVADFILNDAGTAVKLPITEVAKRSGVSVATVSRFYRSLFFENYQHFRIKLAQDLASTIPEIYEDIEIHDSPAAIVRKVFQKNIKSLQDTQKILGTNNILKAARVIGKTKAVHLFGVGGSAAIATDARLKFMHLGINAVYYDDICVQLISTLSLKKDETAIAISHSGKTRSTLDFLSLAKKFRANTICITNYANSPITEFSDICLLTALKETKVKSAALSSRIAQLCIIDALYILIAAKKSGEIAPYVRKINENVEKYLRAGASLGK